MSFRLSKSLRGFRPLACVGDALYLSRGNRILRGNLSLSDLEPVCTLPLAEAGARLRPRRLFDRILRRGIQTAMPLGPHHLLAVHRSTLWRIDLLDGSVKLDFTIPQGRRLLSLARIETPAGGRLCFGEYFDNANRGPVNVWSRPDSAEGAWEITGRFEAGEIYHVHAIAQDPVTRATHVLTGDFMDEAGIWTSTPALDQFTPLLRGRQDHRATWMWRSPGGRTFYATDTQLAANALMELQRPDVGCPDGQATTARIVAGIEGSSIYSAHGERFAVFSSSVEPGEPSGQRWRDLLERRRGPGILSEWARIYHLDAAGDLSVVFSARKDGWPHRLAQFGTFTFPTGQLPDGVIVAYGIALRGVDDTCLLFTAA